ncbi:MAG: SDR family NAD(P)-dependent oxidoreductase [Proteobacteria bacterium]|nr:SDR family NAD(P)-dependent oxidoreductase [Pseudomonadota bacterium]
MPKPDLRHAKAYVVTGPTSGIGRLAALELAKHGTVILAGRDRAKLDVMQRRIVRGGGKAVAVTLDLSDVASARRAAAEIAALHLPIAGVLNNAGMREAVPTKSAQGWDRTFATNHLGPFAFTEALIPHLADGTTIVFVVSAVENPERPMAKRAGFLGGRYISAEASARGEWKSPNSKVPGFDSYATSKQAALAAALELARENPRLRVNAVEPGLIMNTGLSRHASLRMRIRAHVIFPLVQPFVKAMSTQSKASRLLARLMRNDAGATGIYYDESGDAMKQTSQEVRDPDFTKRVVAETRALLAEVG